jgi:hypothetical protein
MLQLHNVVGIVGVLLVLVAYFLHHAGRMSRDVLSYSVLNAVGSAMILVSLYYEVNVPAIAMEGSWLIVSLYGAVRLVRERRR